MKHTIFALACMVSIACIPGHAADAYIQLDTHSDDEHSDEKRPTITIKTLYDGGVRTANQTLNLADRKLTSTHDLPKFRTKLQLGTLTLLNTSDNHLQSDDIGTVLRHAAALKTLIATGNKVKSVELLPEHDNLETLFLDNNKIGEFKVAPFCQKFPKLRQLNLEDNPLQSDTITSITGTYAAMEELWFDHHAATPSVAIRCIKAFPNLTCELGAGSRAVQKYYSTTKQQWDDCSDCTDFCTRCECCSVYIAAPLIGAGVGAIIGGIVYACTMQKEPSDWMSDFKCYKYYAGEHMGECEQILRENQKLVQKWMAIFVPLGAVLPPLTYRLSKTVYNWCRTKPHERYKTVHTREIHAEPTFLDLIDNLVEPAPNQEDEVDGQEDEV